MQGGERCPRLPALTGIRIFAALAVYASHVGPPGGAPEVVSNLFQSGYNGVTLFFVLSGFVLALNYFDGFRRSDGTRTRNFFVARMARIYPLYLLVLIYVLIRQHAVGGEVDGWWEHALAVQAWDPQLERAFAFNGPAWSVSVEFFLYACFPMLVIPLSRLVSPRSVLVAAAAVAMAMLALALFFAVTSWGELPWTDSGSAHRWLYRTPVARLGDFVLGILAARLYVQTRGHRAIDRLGAPLAWGAGLTVVGLMCWGGLLLTPWSWDVAYALPAVVFIFGLAVAPWGLPARAAALPPVVLLGEASYAFYLVHIPALALVGTGRWSTTGDATALGTGVLLLAAILAVAIGLHLGFERPARRRLRKAFER